MASNHFFSSMQGNAAYDLAKGLFVDTPLRKGFQKGSDLPDLGETFPYEVFLHDLPSPGGLGQFLGLDHLGLSTQSSLPEQIATQSCDVRGFRNVNACARYDFPPTNTGRNIPGSSATALNAFYERLGSKRSRHEELENSAKRPRTFYESGPNIDHTDGGNSTYGQNHYNNDNVGNEVIQDMNVVNRSLLGMTLSSFVYQGYAYRYVLVLNPIPCLKCKRQFATNEQLLNHMKLAHKDETEGGSNKENTNVVCGVCKGVLANHTNLRRHIQNVHKDGERHECSECGACFSTRYSLARHKSEAHRIMSKKKPKTRRKTVAKSGVVEIGKDNLKVYVCGCCDNVCDLARNMRRHIDLNHIGERRFACEVCGRSFKTKSNMQSHQGSRRCVPRAQGV